MDNLHLAFCLDQFSFVIVDGSVGLDGKLIELKHNITQQFLAGLVMDDIALQLVSPELYLGLFLAIRHGVESGYEAEHIHPGLAFPTLGPCTAWRRWALGGLHGGGVRSQHLAKSRCLWLFITIFTSRQGLAGQPQIIGATKLRNTHVLKAFLAFILEQQLLPTKGPTLLAVSGGIDSVVMSALFRQAELPFAMAHCNFGLRGAAADQDEAWVRALAQQYGVDFYTQAFDVPAHAQARGISTQMAARELRYAWFQSLCEAHEFEKVATAHHSDDSLETVLLHLAKGTGIAGMHGILPAQGRYIRPLLFATKAQIMAYAQAGGLSWREDSSNQEDGYQRNLIRHQVVPPLRRINPNLEATFSTTVARLRQVEALFNEQVAAIRQQVCSQQGEDYYVNVQALQDKPWAPVVLGELLKPFGFAWGVLQQLWSHAPSTGTRLETASHCLYVDRGQWIITPCKAPDSPAAYTLEATTTILAIPPYTLQCTQVPRAQYRLVASPAVAALDWDLLQFPLEVRPWQPGDAFYPLGMQQRKKLSDFLIDSKVPRPHKANVWVVASGGEIVWVVGHRIDDRFKLTECTQQVYVLQLKLPSVPTANG